MILLTKIYALLLSTSMIYSQVVINEYSASNLSTYTDNYSMEEDWIELYNSGDVDIDLGGYYLSDDLDEPTKWMIPYGTIIIANGFRTFWCSGRDESFLNCFHTNFKL